MAPQRQIDFDELERKSVPELWTVDEIFASLSQDTFARFTEDHRLERKPPGIHADSLATYVCMWANTPPDGGLIVIGIEDGTGAVLGCSAHTDQLLEVERRIRGELVPDAAFETKRILAANAVGQADYVVVYRVQYRSNKVVETNKGEAFIRWAHSRHLLTADEVRELQIERGQLSFELEPCGLAWPDSFDVKAIQEWGRSVRNHKGLVGEPQIPQILVAHKLGAIVKGDFVPNNACGLLFANDPQAVVPGCMIRFQRIEGREAGTGKDRNVVQDIWINGTIPRLVEQAADTLATHLRTYRKLGRDGKFYTSPEYPAEAWQEAIVNACVHRSYNLKGANIFIRMFDDRLTIESPGGFPPLVTPENIYDVHHRRNWWLMDALFFLDYVQCENEGTKRIRRAMIESQLPEPKFEQKQIGNALVRVTLENNQVARQAWIDADVSHIIGAAVAKSLTAIERRIINFAGEHGGKIKANEAMNLMDKPRWGSADLLLKKLVEKKIFEKVRKLPRDNRAHYRLVGYVAPPDSQSEE